MKFTARVDELNNALSKMVKIASGNRQQILNHILIEAKDRLLTLTVNNLEMAITISIDADVLIEGKFTLPAVRFSQIVVSSKKQVTVEIIESEAIITEGKSKIKIQGISASEFPKPKTTELDFFEIDSQVFLNGLTKTVYATDHINSNSVLNAVSLNIDNNKIEMAATDGNRLASYENEIQLDKTLTALIPRDTALELIKLCPKQGNISLSLNQNSIYFMFDQLFFISRLLEGQYPRYKQLIPHHNENIAQINTADLITALKKINIILGVAKVENTGKNYKINITNFKFTDNNLSISYKSSEGDLSEELGCIYSGQDLSINFSFNYVLDVLKLIETKDVCFKMGGALSSALILPTSEERFTNLIMPTQIR